MTFVTATDKKSHSPSQDGVKHHDDLYEVRGIEVVLEADKVLLDTPRRHKAVKDCHAASLVVRSTGARPAEGLLPDNRTCAFLVVVHIACRVTQTVSSLEQSLAVL